MTVSLKHQFTSAVADSGDTSLVQPSNWNAEHTLTLATNRLLGRTTAGTGAVEEISAGTGLSLSSGTLAVSTVPLANGGTGATTQADAANAILPSQTGNNGKYLTTDGSNVSWATVSSASGVTSFSAGTTGFTPSTATTGAITLAGTLIVGNGGTGATTLTSNGILYGNATSAIGATAAGTTGQILVGNTSAAPSWSAATSVAVTSINFGTTGLTPSAVTQGAVTVAGTLVAANGGTGQSSYTVGDILYASTTTALSKLADVATGNALISGGVGTAPSWGKIGLTTHVSGTLPVANGGTNATTANAALTNLTTWTSTATAAGTTVLTNTSTYFQFFTGTSTQTITLPVTSTLATGWTFHIVNNSTGNLTVNSSGGNLVITVIPGTTVMATCIGTSLTTAADWEAGYTDFSTATGTGDVVLGTSPTITTPTIVTSAVIPIVNGGTTSSSTLILQSTSGTGSTDYIALRTGSQSERFRIGPAGQFGIGGATYGTSGQVLTSGGASAAPTWSTVSASVTTVSKSTNYSVLTSDKGVIIEVTAAATLSLPAVSTAGSGFYFYALSSATGATAVVLDPNGAETIDGLSTLTIYPGDFRLVYLNAGGTAWVSEMLNSGTALFSSSGTFILPSNAKTVRVVAFGAGGGGASGAQNASGAARAGGPGGGGGAFVERVFSAADIGAAGTSVTITVGGGGTGGAAQTTAATAGNNGVAGGNTSFGTLIVVGGGGYGGGTLSSNAAGGGGGGMLTAGGNGPSAAAGGGVGGTTNSNGTSWIGAGSQTNAAGKAAEAGGAAGGGATGNGAAGLNGGTSLWGGGGGAGGAGNPTANTANIGGTGGGTNTYSSTGGGGGTAGANTSGAGGAGANGNYVYGGAGGGGGGANGTGAGGAGGNGGTPGGGGGGGSAGTAANSGKGGDGGNGQILVTYA